jgi:diadenosine tetraphosphate (Ap4A) HIT family hydrolase
VCDAAVVSYPHDDVHCALQALTRAVQKATGCAGVRVRQNNGPAAGQVVPQLHFHVIPVEGPEDEVRAVLLCT